MEESIRILIIAPSGRFGDSLRVLLRAGPGMTVVGQAANRAVGFRMVAEQTPALVLLSTGLPDDDAWLLLRQLTLHYPQVRCCVLVNNLAEEKRAHLDGAHAVLQPGFSTEELYQKITALFSPPQAALHKQ